MQNNFTVYCHISPSGKRYVGITGKRTLSRWRKDGSGYFSSPHISRAIKKYGWDNFQHIIIAENLSKEWACKIEIDLIRDWKLQDPKFGYNISYGGEVHQHLDETKKKISITKTGRKDSEETRRKKSMSGKGKHHRTMTEAEKENLRNYWKGKSHGHNTTNNRKWMTSGYTTVLVASEDIQKYLNNGYRFGRQRNKED